MKILIEQVLTTGPTDHFVQVVNNGLQEEPQQSEYFSKKTVWNVQVDGTRAKIAWLTDELGCYQYTEHTLNPARLLVSTITSGAIQQRLHDLGVIIEQTAPAQKVLNYYGADDCSWTLICRNWSNIYSVIRCLSDEGVPCFWDGASTPIQRVLLDNNIRVGDWYTPTGELTTPGRINACAISVAIHKDGTVREIGVVGSNPTDEFRWFLGEFKNESAMLSEFRKFWMRNTFCIVFCWLPPSSAPLQVLASKLSLPTLELEHQVWMSEFELASDSQGGWGPLPEWTLSGICKEVGDVSTQEISLETIKPGESLNRARAIMHIATFKSIIPDLTSLAKLIGGIPYGSLIHSGATKKMECFWHLFPVKLLPLPCSYGESDNTAMQGGLNIKPTDFIKKNAIEADISSAYPSEIIASTLDPPCWKVTPGEAEKVDGVTCENGIVTYVRHLVEARRASQGSDVTAIKLMANVVYGWLCIHFKPLARIVTRLGREKLQRMVDALNQEGMHVACADTDGAVVETTNPTRAIEVAQKAAGGSAVIHQGKTMDCCLLFSSKKWSWVHDGHVSCKGTICRQASQPALLRKLEHDLSLVLLNEAMGLPSAQTVEGILKEAFDSLATLKVDSLKTMERVMGPDKPNSDIYLRSHLNYPETALPGVVCLVHAYHRSLGTRGPVLVDDLAHNSWLDADNRYYVTRIITTAERLLNTHDLYCILLEMVSAKYLDKWP
jgi:hypothetical protein